ncbi:hypothetical protein Pla52n_70590 [Stieleria varia]|uniref:Uncharacterized protein n=1 Tax=Stieleria varia TaxID=2528005 RepID=A0A5C5ZIH6_9BACT|nr:hypothetical protein Pla52n_70590 [Stieleria varia]
MPYDERHATTTKIPRRQPVTRVHARGGSRRCHQPVRNHVLPTPHRLKRRCIFNAVTQVESCSRDPIGYVDGTSLLSSYFGLKSTDPFGNTIVGIDSNGNIINKLDTGDCQIDSPNGPKAVPCPNTPYDPKYLAGLSGIRELSAFLAARCQKCRDECECKAADCVADARAIARRFTD